MGILDNNTTRKSSSSKLISFKEYMTRCADFDPITLNVINYTDEKWIKDAIEAITRNEPISKGNGQSAPSVSTSTLLIYEDNQKYFVEFPYQGVYEIDKGLYEQLLNYRNEENCNKTKDICCRFLSRKSSSGR